MRDKVYLRIGKSRSGRFIYKVDKTKKNLPVSTGNNNYLPTIIVGLNLDIPDEYFNKATAEIDLKVDKFETATDINVEGDKDEPKV